MYGRPQGFAHGGGGRESAPPPQEQPQHHLLGANFNLNNFVQNPNDLLFLHNLNLYFPSTHRNPNNFLFQNQNFQANNNNFLPQNPRNHFQSFPQTQPVRPFVKEGMERIDREVVKARRDILASGDYVSAWKVSQAVCLSLQVDSWESLGFPMQQVPSLHNLIVTEGKVKKPYL